jgi:hypothetical protein
MGTAVAALPYMGLHSCKKKISFMPNYLILICYSCPDRDKYLYTLMYSGARIDIAVG